jgi:2-C-methyl-D-erythritol 4-phosphate cytidylyltransferase
MNPALPQNKTWVIVPASGQGRRFSETENKLLLKLAGTPVLVRSVQACLSASTVQGVVLVCRQENQAVYRALLQEWLPDAPIIYASGGETRRESVERGLKALPNQESVAVIHDAARPLVPPELIDRVIQEVYGGSTGAIAALPMRDTVKQLTENSLTVENTLDRSILWRAQTPQGFQRSLLQAAHVRIPKSVPVTDDAQLMELAGFGPIVAIPGDERNLKITTTQDIQLAEAFLKIDAP